MRASDLLVRCVENEGVTHIFGLPGEEILEVLDSLSRSRISFIPTRHEQGAAFMANVYGRLTGMPGVCLATLGPGASNLITGVADAYLDHAPLVAITGQTSLLKTHKEAHQYVDVVAMLKPVTKWGVRIERPEIIPEAVRKAFKIAEGEKPGPTHIELPEDIAGLDVEGAPLPVTHHEYPLPSPTSIEKALALLREARSPIILAGNGVARRKADQELRAFATSLQIPVAHTFMGIGGLDYTDPLSLLSVGMQARDWVMCGFDQADLVIAVGYDLEEYSPRQWNPDKQKKIIHIDVLPSGTDECYVPEVEIIAEIGEGLKALRNAWQTKRTFPTYTALREAIFNELREGEGDPSFPLKPQRVLADIRKVLGEEDLLVCDVGMHKIWVARMFPAHKPNTVLISNGYASMGIAVPGAIAAQLVYPRRKVIAVVGDGGFLMTSCELETAKRLGLSFVVVIWSDSGYGMIEWKQVNRFGKPFGVSFSNPDFVKYAESFGLPGFRVQKADDLLPILKKALGCNLPAIVEVPIDYQENFRLTEKLGHLIAPM